MFHSGPNYSKLKTNLRLAINRLKLLEKKKTELALKARKEIAEYISVGKIERAKIRVEHIIREDYLVEAMEVTEMYCDLLLARFGLIQQMKDLDEGLAEAISSLIWVAPRLQTDVAELKLVADNLALKYGRPYAQACCEQAVSTISEKLIHKLSVQAPPKILVEQYLIEIAKNYNIEYEADPQVMRESEWEAQDPLISFADKKNDLGRDAGSSRGSVEGPNGGEGVAIGFNYPQPSLMDYPKNVTFNDGYSLRKQSELPPTNPGTDTHESDKMTSNAGQWDNMLNLDSSPPPPYSSASPPISCLGNGAKFNQDSHSSVTFPPDKQDSNGGGNFKNSISPKPAPRSKFDEDPGFQLPDLPNVPDLLSAPGGGVPRETSSNLPSNNEDIDFDDLNKRFEELKRKK